MKRSAQVALLLGGLTTVGGASYAMMPAQTECRPGQGPGVLPGSVGSTTAPGLAAPMPGTGAQALAPGAAPENPCRENRRRWHNSSSYGSSYGYGNRGRTIWGRSSSSSGAATATSAGTSVAPIARTSSPSTSSSVPRSGFGSIASAFGGHSSS